jgi:polyphenol oxidase
MMATRFGSTRSDLRVSIGPSAGPCCYEVDDPVLDQLRTGLPEWKSVVHDYPGRKVRLDLKALIRRQVEGDGVCAHSVSSVNLCTICQDQLFYSYRREGRVNGTMVSGIALLSHR